MDRRTRLAFLLIAIILGINAIFIDRMAKKQPIRKEIGTQADSDAATSPETRDSVQEGPNETPQEQDLDTPSPEAAAQNQLFAQATGMETDVVVVTPLQQIRISPRGAVLQELLLNEYDHADRTRLVNLVPPMHSGQALGLVLQTPSGEIDLKNARFELLEGAAGAAFRLEETSGPRTFSFRAQAQGGGAIVKRFTIYPNQYEFDVDIEFEPGVGLPQVYSYQLLWTSGFPTTEADQKDDLTGFKVFSRVDETYKSEGLAGVFGGGGEGEKINTVSGHIEWLGMRSKYFTIVLVPEGGVDGTANLRRDYSRAWEGIELNKPQAWSASPRESFSVYAGPISYDLLKAKGQGLESIVDLGWRWIRPFSWVMLAFMNFLHKFISNYGVIILIISALIKFAFWGLTKKTYQSMREMQELQPMMQALRERYKDDPKEMNRQSMELYKKRGVNPLGGCMPMVIQMPFFFALFNVLRSNIELRHAPFVGWINNLAAPDVLFKLPFSLPLLGDNFSLLPLLMGVGMLMQSAMGSPMGAPAATTGPAAQQQKIMKWFMPIMFTGLFYRMPSGLVLYWLVNTVLSVLQQVQINRSYAAAPKPVSPVEVLDDEKEGKSNGAPDRSDGSNRRRGPRKGSGRTRSKTR